MEFKLKLFIFYKQLKHFYIFKSIHQNFKMKGRLFIVASLIGLMMTCTLVTAQASDYRKETKELSLSKFEASTVLVAVSTDLIIAKVNCFVTASSSALLLVPVNKIDFYTSVIYLSPKNKDNPDNRRLYGLINERRKSERITEVLHS